MKYINYIAIIFCSTMVSPQLYANDKNKKCEEVIEINEMIKCFQQRNREKIVVGDPGNILFDLKRGMTTSDIAKTQELIHGGK